MDITAAEYITFDSNVDITAAECITFDSHVDITAAECITYESHMDITAAECTQCGPKILGVIFFFKSKTHTFFVQNKLHWHIYRLLCGRTVSEKLPKVPLMDLL